MTDNEKKRQRIKTLTFLYQYIFTGASVVIPILIAVCFSQNIQTGFFFWLGVFAIAYGVYTLCGFLLGWKHIFCAYQNMHNQRVTPEAEQFEVNVRKGALKTAVQNLVMGAVLLLLVHFF